MRIRPTKPVAAAMLGVLMLAALPSGAQTSAPDTAYRGTGAAASPELRRHHDMQPLMDDMAAQLAKMRDRMAKGDMTPAAEREMAAQMQELSALMRRMAGLIDRPTMQTPERERQLAELRGQLDALNRAHP
ncbi:MAG TPA: hypothetical protein VLC47_07450 [Burkholderiales bacterium]|nr:hypothetical protein [Burkholderiales bacterium]